MRVLVITSSSGGGHDMRAASFRRWVERLTDWEVTVHQALEDTHPVYRFGVGLYNWIQDTWPALHHVYYNYLELVGTVTSGSRILGGAGFEALVREVEPDLVLSTMDHLNHGFFDLARRALGRERVRCVTYCGELYGGYGFSRHWVNPDADLFIGAVPELEAVAQGFGMPASRVVTGGFLLHPDFYEPVDGPAEREALLGGELDLDPSAFTLLLATGAVGANNHVALLKRLERRARPLQVIALCGRNDRAREAVGRWAESARHVTVRALGYRERMAPLVRSSSAIVARPGTGTTSESIQSACPIIFNGIGGVMPQEYITVKYARHHGVEEIIRRPGDIVPILDRWQDRPELLQARRDALRALRPRLEPRDVLALAAGREI